LAVENRLHVEAVEASRRGVRTVEFDATSIAELMKEIRKLPDDELLTLAAQVDAEAARAVDERFAAKVREGDFDGLAAEALRELREGKTVPLHEILDERHVS
jgi:methionine synthase II (cobalamin-independent)